MHRDLRYLEKNKNIRNIHSCTTIFWIISDTIFFQTKKIVSIVSKTDAECTYHEKQIVDLSQILAAVCGTQNKYRE